MHEWRGHAACLYTTADDESNRCCPVLALSPGSVPKSSALGSAEPTHRVYLHLPRRARAGERRQRRIAKVQPRSS
jgi:hypothetical protein